MNRLIYSVLLSGWVYVVLCKEPKVVDLGGGRQKIVIKNANLTEEETHSTHMPSSLLCDACRIVSYQISTRLDKMHTNMKNVIKKKGRLKESDVLNLIDDICEDKSDVFNTIGIKEVFGMNRLSGPGLETEQVPGMMQGGGKWPSRLKELCSLYAGDVGEEEIYAAYRRGEDLDDFLCFGTGLRGYCNYDPKETESSKAQREGL